MNILLTGATGFIGSHLLKWLDAEGHSTTVLLRPTSNRDKINDTDVILFDGDIERLKTLLIEKEIEGIVHLASLFLAQHSPQQIKALVDSNILLGLQLLEAAATANVKWFLNTGSIWQNYNVPDFSDRYNPVNLYAATKQAFMTLARYYTETSALRFATLKLSDTYGPGDTRRKVMQLFEECADSGRQLDMSPGEQRISLVHVDEVCQAFLALIDALSRDDIPQNAEFSLNSAEMPTLRELAARYEQQHAVHLNIRWGGRPYRPREVMTPYRGNPICIPQR